MIISEYHIFALNPQLKTCAYPLCYWIIHKQRNGHLCSWLQFTPFVATGVKKIPHNTQCMATMLFILTTWCFKTNWDPESTYDTIFSITFVQQCTIQIDSCVHSFNSACLPTQQHNQVWRSWSSTHYSPDMVFSTLLNLYNQKTFTCNWYLDTMQLSAIQFHIS
jgi:hypothetical protein